ncbi:LOW QUALITY PROTEIN: sialic acid-binding Ig-like lectin 8 [Prionailurus bengalensis]|uniref:LOW QUALITY PROTEIN: sialic acid-binding Ig-like lectin 8 n=1 Tax=Prionailurus bengalensis TaxID=37029 RepID=UPI001CA9AE40|nr:LOW QUALITY PROTEIN: sialic acid-binding Ig-like lectin 8 [Prionailurus bengalensis]
MLLLLLALLWGREGPRARGAGRGPQGDYWLQVQDAKGQEGLCVRVPCRCFYPREGWSESTPALGYWFRKGAGVQQDVLVATNNPDGKVWQESQGRFRLLGNPQDYDCSLDIRDVRRGDSGTHVFRVERGPSVRYTYTRDQLSVRVTALTQTPDILISGTLESGRPSNLTCSVPWACAWGTPPIFSWTSAALASPGPKTHLSSVLTLTPRLQDHGTDLTCQVTLPGTGVTTMRTIHLNVSYSPWNLTVTVFQENGTAPTALENGSSLSVLESQSLRLVCVVNSNPPARLSWAQGHLTLCGPNPGVLELPRAQERDEGEYTCRAQNTVGSQHISLSLLLQRKAWPLSERLLGAVGGAGAMALIFLILCIVIILVRSHRKKVTKPSVGTKNTGMESANIVTRSVSQGLLIEAWAGSLPPDAATPSLREEEELHYATLNFHQTETCCPQEQVAPGIEYSEIRIHK